MITLHKLKLFMVVVDRGSFNAAASELLMAQSAVSQHIQSLEAALGTPLFERSARGVTPTPAGDLLYEYAGRMLRLLAEAEREIMQIDTAQTQSLAVGATPGVNVYLLPGWLGRFQEAYPNISVSQHTALTGEVVRDVLHGRDDLGFLEGELDELDDPQLGRMRLRDVEYFVAVSPTHAWAERDAITSDELAAQPLVNRQPNSRARRWLDAKLNAHAIRPRSVTELDSIGAVKYALLSQVGAVAAVLPEYAIRREVERGELHALRLAEVELKRPLLMIWDKRAPFNPRQRAFIGSLAGDAPQLQILL